MRSLRIVREEPDTIALSWKKPVDGGRVTGYKVQRRRQRAAWEDVATSMVTEIEPENQERGVEFEYRVLGFNQAGEGRPSSTVRAVL